MMSFIETILHIDRYLQIFTAEYPKMAYGIIYLIIFMETGVVVTPFLPGDSLLFAAGSLAALGSFKIEVLFLGIFVAAVLGDALNYHIGKFVGPKVFNREASVLFNKEHLISAQAFYEKHGKKTIILARFIPMVRTFAPFVAGIGNMQYQVFVIYNIIGAALWSALFVFGGFLFGNIPWIKEHFGVLVIGIIFVSVIPVLKEVVCHLFSRKCPDNCK